MSNIVTTFNFCVNKIKNYIPILLLRATTKYQSFFKVRELQMLCASKNSLNENISPLLDKNMNIDTTLTTQSATIHNANDGVDYTLTKY